jgi:hypothetical protein
MWRSGDSDSGLFILVVFLVIVGRFESRGGPLAGRCPFWSLPHFSYLVHAMLEVSVVFA